MRFFIYEGDAYSVLDKIAPNSIDIVYTSPSPAFFELKKGVITDKRVLSTEENNIEYMNHLIAILQKVKRVLKPSGSLWLNISDYFSTKEGGLLMVPEGIAIKLVSLDWILMSTLIWSRSDKIAEGNERRFVKDWQPLFWFVKSTEYYFNEDSKYKTMSVFDFPYIAPNDDKFESGYPVELVDIAIDSTCPPNGTVLDIFAGTGTTGVSALNNGRYFVGIEIKPKLANSIAYRLQDLKYKKDLPLG